MFFSFKKWKNGTMPATIDCSIGMSMFKLKLWWHLHYLASVGIANVKCAHNRIKSIASLQSIMKFWSIINRVCNGLTMEIVLSSSLTSLLTLNRYRLLAATFLFNACVVCDAAAVAVKIDTAWIPFGRDLMGSLCLTKIEELCLKVVLLKQRLHYRRNSSFPPLNERVSIKKKKPNSHLIIADGWLLVPFC